MKRYRIVVYTALLISIILGGISCIPSEPVPENLLPEDTYVKLLVEMQLVESYLKTRPKADADSLREIIFKEYGIAKTLFEQSNEYYTLQPQAQMKRLSSALILLEEERKKTVLPRN